MDIPVLTRFINGLKLFFESKRLRWLFAIFIFSAIFTLLFREIGRIVPSFATGFIAVVGGIFPTFFLVAAFMSLLGLQRFIASEESYMRSFIYTIIWMTVSIFLYMMLWVSGMVFILLIGIAFLGWIIFQAFLSSRSALGYAEKVQITSRSKITTFIFGSLHIVSYVIVIGAFIVLVLMNIASGTTLDLPIFVAALLGVALALGFNSLNGFIMIRERKRATVDNLSVLGLFVSLYVAYFLYNILKPPSASIDTISILIDIGISVFFILYAMSAVGLTLASRAHLDTRWKISSELAATIAFFLASGYLVVQALFDVVSGGLLGERIPDVIKLFAFPFVALVMEILFIRRSRKVLDPVSTPEELPAEPESIEEPEEEEITTPEDIVEDENDSSETMDSSDELRDDEPDTEEESESFEE